VAGEEALSGSRQTVTGTLALPALCAGSGLHSIWQHSSAFSRAAAFRKIRISTTDKFK
jgi:hypothetical protein